MSVDITREASERIFDLLEQDLSALWEDIQAMPEDTPAELWKKKLQKIGEEYALSSRFALMRILYSRARGCSLSGQDSTDISDADFEAYVQGNLCRFQDISLEHAKDLSPEEHRLYMTYMLELADLQADSDPEVNAAILSRAWHDEASANLLAEKALEEQGIPDEKQAKKIRDAFHRENKQKYKNRLTKEEALQLGHILDFSLQEMQWFLLRTFDVAEGFRFNQSEDLIEAYGFLTGASWQHVRQLKDRYQQISGNTDKNDGLERGSGWTKDVSDSLLGRVASWKLRPEIMDEQFLEWMHTQAPGLDIPSRTAGRIYRNLVAFACDLITGEEIVPEEEAFTECIQEVYEEMEDSGASRRLFYQDGALSERRCKEIADVLLLENKVQSISIQEDNTKAWHVLGTLGDGTLTSAGGIVNSGRTRVADILSGKIQAEKSDMLYLLWFTANLIWQSNDIPGVNALCCRVLDFMDTAKYLLEEALLPEFYLPHPIEQSMLLSIVSGRSEDDAPCVVYEYMLQTLTKQRQRKQGSRKHDAAFKLEVVSHYRSHPEMTLEECALLFEISPKTLSAWQKKLLDEGKIQ